MKWNPFAKKSAEARDGNSESQQQLKNNRQKNAPTPKRNVSQAQKLRPIVPVDREESARRNRIRIREKENAEYEAMRSGDLAHMPKYEQLPWRVYIRDYVDARINIGEYFIPFSLVLMVIIMSFSFVSMRIISVILTVVLYVYLLICAIDVFIMWRRLRKELISKYGPQSVSRSSRSFTYAWSRAIQLRRWRLPKPRYKKHGVWPK
ncbi:DUF3043 domain-containing protein [uncultured Gardnerella sp.]|uniref:DUF3043 domain-containing protein n=1 Tax=uncultured Gardnerella sp. TaxID=293424 RepID=UPI002626DC8D|nr:DUF3043 domain-containing protein [uncultured Gardnerella sp.]